MFVRLDPHKVSLLLQPNNDDDIDDEEDDIDDEQDDCDLDDDNYDG